jgi:hypothetical protein
LNESVFDRIIIDYDGAKIKNHQMDIDDFVQSIAGFADLLKIVANELKLPEDAIDIQIAPLEKGSLKATIIALIKWSLLTSAGYVAWNVADELGAQQAVKTWARETLTFVKEKRDVKIDSVNLAQKSADASTIQGRLLQIKDAHTAVNDIVRSLTNNNAETIDIQLLDQSISEHFDGSNIANLISDPFNEPSIKEEVSVEEKDIRLYLENVGITGTKWAFYEKLSEKRIKRISAEVLDDDLLKDARNSALEQKYKNVPLLCKVRIKTYKKPGAKRTSPPDYYIIDCQKDEPLTLFPISFPDPQKPQN